MIKMDVNHNDELVLHRIVERTLENAEDALGDDFTPREDEHAQLVTSLVACHLNGCPLDLLKLYGADNATLAHDVFGIDKHISKNTGELDDHFRPRCAL